jgi:uncharacterized protein YndB with AHSA1/START domain
MSIKKFALIILGLVFLLGLALIVSHFQFKKYAQQQSEGIMNVPVNQSAPVLANQSIDIAAPIEIVWEVLSKIEEWPNWQDPVTKSEVRGTLEEGVIFIWKADGMRFRSRIHTLQKPVLMGWTGTTFGAQAVHNWQLEDNASNANPRTTVRVEESLQGVFPLLLAKSMSSDLEGGMSEQLEALRETAEAQYGRSS